MNESEGMMDAFEATKIVTSRMRSSYPENGLEVLDLIMSHPEAKQIIMALAATPHHVPFSYRLNQIKANLLSQPRNPTPLPNAAIPKLPIHYNLAGMGPSIPPLNQRDGRNEISSSVGMGGATNSNSRQIYLSFEIGSTFTEGDALNYFQQFGAVESVTIPRQKERRFGFVKFVLPEAVLRVLALPNPHYVAASCVFVNPYVERRRLIPPSPSTQSPHLEREESSSSIARRSPHPNLPTVTASSQPQVVESTLVNISNDQLNGDDSFPTLRLQQFGASLFR